MIDCGKYLSFIWKFSGYIYTNTDKYYRRTN